MLKSKKGRYTALRTMVVLQLAQCNLAGIATNVGSGENGDDDDVDVLPVISRAISLTFPRRSHLQF